jgi:hypothetical protein
MNPYVLPFSIIICHFFILILMVALLAFIDIHTFQQVANYNMMDVDGASVSPCVRLFSLFLSMKLRSLSDLPERSTNTKVSDGL